MVGKITNLKLRIVGLYRGNYLAKFHPRGMARLLKTSHATLLPHLRSLEKDRIFNSEPVGRHLEYTLNIPNPATKKYLMMAEEAAALNCLDTVPYIRMWLKDMAELKLEGIIILFGSRVKGYAHEESDFDILYVGNLPKKKAESIKTMARIFNQRIDLKRLSLKGFKEGLWERDVLTREVVADHIILQGSSKWTEILWMYVNETRL